MKYSSLRQPLFHMKKHAHEEKRCRTQAPARPPAQPSDGRRTVAAPRLFEAPGCLRGEGGTIAVDGGAAPDRGCARQDRWQEIMNTTAFSASPIPPQFLGGLPVRSCRILGGFGRVRPVKHLNL